jgi:hypothetical protein
VTARGGWLAVLVLVAAACPRQVAGPRPRAAMHSAYNTIREDLPGVAVLGEEIVVHTGWFAQCEDWEPRTGEWVGARPCNSLDYQLAIECDAPCGIGEDRITPQQVGPLTVTVTMTGPKETAVFRFAVKVLPADGFYLAGCTNAAIRDGVIEERKPIRTDGERCTLGMTSVGVGVLAGEYALRLPVQVGGQLTDRLTPEVIAAATGRAADIPPGSYSVELRYHELARILQVEVSPESLAGQSR